MLFHMHQVNWLCSFRVRQGGATLDGSWGQFYTTFLCNGAAFWTKQEFQQNSLNILEWASPLPAKGECLIAGSSSEMWLVLERSASWLSKCETVLGCTTWSHKLSHSSDPTPPKIALFGKNLQGKVSERMKIKGYCYSWIKFCTGHDYTVNLKKIDQAVSELEHWLGLGQMYLGLVLRYLPKCQRDATPYE